MIDFDTPDNNDWLVVNQFTITENRNRRHSDIVVFVNGLPLGSISALRVGGGPVIELNNPGDQEATVWIARQQLHTYNSELPSLFWMNEVIVASDGMETRAGTLTAGREWFTPWRTIDGEQLPRCSYQVFKC